MNRIREFFRRLKTNRVYAKNPYWKRPTETIAEYHLRIAIWRGDSAEHLKQMMKLTP